VRPLFYPSDPSGFGVRATLLNVELIARKVVEEVYRPELLM